MIDKRVKHLCATKGNYTQILCAPNAAYKHEKFLTSDPYYPDSNWNLQRDCFEWCDVCVMLLLAKQGEK